MKQDLTSQYIENGFVIVKDIVPKERIEILLENIYRLYCRFSENYDEFKEIEKPWKTDLFQKKLLELRQNDKESFGAIYDSLKTSVSLIQLVTEDEIVDCVSKFLGVKSTELSLAEPMLRLDPPEDKRNTLGWHQERSFFPQNRNGLHSLVCWIPLTNVTVDMGAVQVCPKSHNEGLLRSKPMPKTDSTYTTQIPVPEEAVKKYPIMDAPMMAGDALFFNMLLFHRSGFNSSSKIRFSLQGRFLTSTASDFIPFDLINYYNPFIKRKLIEKKFDCSDIPDNIRQPPIAY